MPPPGSLTLATLPRKRGRDKKRSRTARGYCLLNVPGGGADGHGAGACCCWSGHGEDACCAGACVFCAAGGDEDGHGAAPCAGCACVFGVDTSTRVGFGFEATRFFGFGFGFSAAGCCSADAVCAGCACSGFSGSIGTAAPGCWATLPCMYSGGMPWLTPGTPSGNNSLRSPGSFFFSFRWKTSSLSGSKSAHAVNARPNAPSSNNIAARWKVRMISASALSLGRNHRGQDIGTCADSDRTFRVRCDHIEIAARIGEVVVTPGRQRQQLAGAVAETARRLCNRVKALLHFRQGGRVNQQHRRAHCSKITPNRRQRSIGRKLVIGLYRVTGFGFAKDRRCTKPCEHAIAVGRFSRYFRESRLSLCPLALITQGQRRFEIGA